MVPLLRSCILSRRILFSQEVISLKRVFVYSTCSDVKKQTPISQGISSYKIKENDQKELIYIGSIATTVQRIKVFSYLTSAISIIAQPILYMKMINDDNTMSLATICMLLNFAAICNPILIYLLTKRYVVDLHYYPKEQKYVAQVYNFFFRRKKIEFTAKDVTEPRNEFSKLFTSCYVKKQPLLFDFSFTSDSKHYFIIMGYKTLEDFEAKPLEIPAVNKLSVNRLSVNASKQAIECKIKENQ
ncbi:transmembrane protein 70 homolog, mitochondrial [Xylocopa sonorina]|uniref:transmembrane protein 70 homolog, mitochondrial n=1 Tax=Xylocopa sonorina TaxID=1818115 RepID=UPI00403AFF34